MNTTDLPVLHDRLNELADALGGKRPTPQGMKVWADTLREFALHDIVDVLMRWAKQQTKAPAPADVWKVLNAKRTDRLEESSANDKARAEADVVNLRRRDPVFAKKLHALALELTANQPRKDPKAWASKIYDYFLADRDWTNGKPVTLIQIDFACQALKIKLKDAFEARERQRERVRGQAA